MLVLFKTDLSAPVNLDPNFRRHGPQLDGSADVAIGEAETYTVLVNQVEHPVGLALYHSHLQARAAAEAAVSTHAIRNREKNGNHEGKSGKLGPDHHSISTTHIHIVS